MTVVIGTKTELDQPIISTLLSHFGVDLASFEINETHQAEAPVSYLSVKVRLYDGSELLFRLKAEQARTLAGRTSGYQGWIPAKYKLDPERMLSLMNKTPTL